MIRDTLEQPKPTRNAAREQLRKVFGYSQFRPPQDEVIDTLLGGQNAFVLMPTGGGKSLCYQVPALLLPGLTIVVSPLIALMQDQIYALQANGVAAAGIHSGMSQVQKRQVFYELHQGTLDLLYVSPERLALDSMKSFLKDVHISLIAFDEAHCVSQWGHDFRPDYQALSYFIDQFADIPRIALTATANDSTRTDITRALRLENARWFVGNFDRPNIHYAVEESQGDQKARLLEFIRSSIGDGSGIVYCTTKKKVEQTYEWLREQGINAIAYHAGMTSKQREASLSEFLQQDGRVAVATIAFGMGIDKADVRFVAHLNLPKSLEAYYQETGRAGRDGLPSKVWMSYSLGDMIQLRRWVRESDASAQVQQIESQKLNAILGYAETSQCRRQLLLQYFGQTLEQPCGACDNCHAPPAVIDMTREAQMALSTVHHTGQRFGVTHSIQVLRGTDTARVRQFRHQNLTTYKIGQHLSEREWKRVFQQLILAGALEVDVENYNSLKLREPCRPILKGDQQLHLRKLTRSEISDISEQTQGTRLTSQQSSILKLVKNLRRALAKGENVPAATLFADATLIDFVLNTPKNAEELLQVQGFGHEKVQRFGEIMLNFLQECCQLSEAQLDEGFSASMWLSVFEYKKLGSLSALLAKRSLTQSTLESHLIQGAEKRWLAYADLPFDMSAEEMHEVAQFVDTQPNQGSGIAQIAAQLGQKYTYGQIRYVQSLVWHNGFTANKVVEN